MTTGIRKTKDSKYLFPHEVFGKLSMIKSFHDKIAFLRDNATYSVRMILQVNFTPSIELDLPPGNPPYTPDTNPPENSMARIDKAIKVISRLLKGPHESGIIERASKETRFLQLLESVHGQDAQIIIAMKDKKIEKLFPEMNHILAHAAFPEFIPAP